MQPIEKVLSRVRDYKPSGNGYSACCPAHDDHNPSLSVSEGEDGRVLLKCFAGCPAENVVNALGLQMADLFPTCQAASMPFTSRQETSTFATADEAVAAHGYGKPDHQWSYFDAEGTEVGRTIRWNKPGDKVVRPIARGPNGWTLTGSPAPRPLFNLSKLLADPATNVFVVEGEKCADALTSLGLLATTSAFGSSAARQTDWSPLAGRDVIILPDNDEGGTKYAEEVSAMIRDLGATVRIVTFDDLPPGGDVADLFAKCSDESDRTALRGRIVSLADVAKPLEFHNTPTPETESDGYVPFPVTALPKPVADFVHEAAASVGVDAAYVALPVLTLLGAAIGNTRHLRVKAGHDVPAILWTGIVGLSGTGKSPALKIAMKAAYAHEARLRKQQQGGRFVVVDTTTEALAELMATNPRGLFCVNDELAGWLGSIDRYKTQKQRCSAEQAFLLSAFDGDSHSIDRRTGQNRHLHIPRASLWVTGGIQPGVLANFMGKAEREAGLLARLLLASPPTRPLTYSDDEVSSVTAARFEEVVSRLFALEGEETVLLSEEAKRLWITFHNQTAREAARLPPDLAAAWIKSAGTALRIALIVYLASPSGNAVSVDTMRQAITLTEWFKNEYERTYRSLGFGASRSGQAPAEPDTELKAWIEKQPDGVAVRDIQRKGPAKFRGAGVAAACVDRLAAAGELQRLDDGHGVSRYMAVEHDAADRPLTVCPASTSPLPDVASPAGQAAALAKLKADREAWVTESKRLGKYQGA
jgi:hypothetical protein